MSFDYMNVSCVECAYWDYDAAEDSVRADKAESVWNAHAACRRHPPVVFVTPRSIDNRFPITIGTSWCGEHVESPYSATREEKRTHEQLERR